MIVDMLLWSDNISFNKQQDLPTIWVLIAVIHVLDNLFQFNEFSST